MYPKILDIYLRKWNDTFRANGYAMTERLKNNFILVSPLVIDISQYPEPVVVTYEVIDAQEIELGAEVISQFRYPE